MPPMPQVPVGGFHVEAETESVTVRARDAAIEAVLAEFARQHGLRLFVDGPLVGRTTLDVHGASAAAALQRILKGRDFALLSTSAEARGGPRSSATGVRLRGRLWVFPKTGGESDTDAGPVVGGKSTFGTAANGRSATAGEIGADRKTTGTGVKVERLQAALSHDDPAVRAEAISELWETGGDQATAMLMTALSDAEPWIRQETAHAIGAAGGVNSVPALKQIVRDTDVHVRQAAVEALGYIHEPASARALGYALNDPAPSVRAQAVQVLGDLGGAAATSALHEALDDPDHEVRRETVFALRRIGGSVAVKALTKSLKDGNPVVRRETVNALGAVGGDHVEPLLRQALNDSDASVQAAAREMLARYEASVK